MNVVRIETGEDLARQLLSLSNSYAYRGQADSAWRFESSLERLLKSNWSEQLVRAYEDHFLSEFKSKYRIYDRENHLPETEFGWFSIMQHYGIPTRLIDFTLSPLVALYFALESYDFEKSPDFAIYCINYTKLNDITKSTMSAVNREFSEKSKSRISDDELFDKYINGKGYDVLWMCEPSLHNVRIDRQAGTFMVSATDAKPIGEILEGSKYKDCENVKFIISGKIWKSAFDLLRKANVNAKVIYGDLSGLAKSVKFQMQAYSTK